MSVEVFVALLFLTVIGFLMGKRKARSIGRVRVHSLPVHYGSYVALWCVIPSVLVLLLSWMGANSFGRLFSLGPERARLAAAVLTLSIAIVGFLLSYQRISPSLPARSRIETFLKAMLAASSVVAIVTTIGIVASLLFEALRFFSIISPFDFLFGLTWSPQIALRSDQIGSSGLFGAVPLFAATLMVGTVAMAIAIPIGLLSAIYMAEYASLRTRSIIKPLLEILAGVPTVVYGFFAVLTVGPGLRALGDFLFAASWPAESAMAAGIVMGIMIVPFISSLSDDIISAVPQGLRQGSLGIGATRSETIVRILLPAALPGIVSGVLLAVSRAIGETMIVVMAAGMGATLSANPFESMATVTVQIVNLLGGDQEFDNPKTLAAFALGLTLFCATLLLNIIALWVVDTYREKYD